MIEENGITYTKVGDYYLPDLLPPGERSFPGKYGLLRERFLREHRDAIYTWLLLTGKLNAHLLEVNRRATEQIDELVREMARRDGTNEELKGRDQMRWVGLMNNYKARAEEIVLPDTVYE